MKAIYDGHKIIIEIDINQEKIAGPSLGGRSMHYIPCSSNCGYLLLAPWDVVSCECFSCIERRENGEA